VGREHSCEKERWNIQKATEPTGCRSVYDLVPAASKHHKNRTKFQAQSAGTRVLRRNVADGVMQAQRRQHALEAEGRRGNAGRRM